MKRIVFFFSVLMSFSLVHGQDINYVDDTISVEYAKGGKFLDFEAFPYYESTGFQQYRPFGVNRLPIARSGNLGLPVHSYNIQAQNWNSFHHIGAYQMYQFLKDSMKYYRMSRPFTQLRYTNGSESEQLFNVFHSQNVGEGLNFSFEYRRMTSEGYYIKQLTNHTQFNASYNLTDRNKRFKSRGYFYINDLEAQENGGIVLSERDEEEEENTVLLDINLTNGQNQIRSSSFSTHNEYDLLYLDSLNSLLNISHEIAYTRSYRKYRDDTLNAAGFYNNFFLDDFKSADSTYTKEIENSLLLNFLNKTLSLGVKNKHNQFFQNYLIDKKFVSNFLVAGFDRKLFGLDINSTLEKGLSGFYQNEFSFSARVKLPEYKGLETILNLKSSKEQPDYLLMNQRINHYFFSNKFTTSDCNHLSLLIKLDKYRMSINTGFNNFKGFVYYDQEAIPQQYAESISSIFIELNKKINFLKHWNLNNRIRYQTNSEKEILPLPELYSYHSLFYENVFFKSSLLFQIGADLYYIGQYKGYRYSPALNQFYLNKEGESMGKDSQLDLFVNMRVNKSARIFLKMENILSNSFSEETYRIQDYPIPGRSFKVGLSWRMIN